MPVPGDVVTVRLACRRPSRRRTHRTRAFALERRTARGPRENDGGERGPARDGHRAGRSAASPADARSTAGVRRAGRHRCGDLLPSPTSPAPSPPSAFESIVPRVSRHRRQSENRRNVDALRELIHGRRALLAGNSGVGKSTIFRALGGETAVGEVSRYGIGRQTTTAGRLYRDDRGFLIDSPGINEFGLGTIGPAALRRPSARCGSRRCAAASPTAPISRSPTARSRPAVPKAIARAAMRATERSSWNRPKPGESPALDTGMIHAVPYLLARLDVRCPTSKPPKSGCFNPRNARRGIRAPRAV